MFVCACSQVPQQLLLPCVEEAESRTTPPAPGSSSSSSTIQIEDCDALLMGLLLPTPSTTTVAVDAVASAVWLGRLQHSLPVHSSADTAGGQAAVPPA